MNKIKIVKNKWHKKECILLLNDKRTYLSPRIKSTIPPSLRSPTWKEYLKRACMKQKENR